MDSWHASVVKSDTFPVLPKIRRSGAAFHRAGAFRCSPRCRLNPRFAREAGSLNTRKYKKPVHPDGMNRFLELLGRFELPTSSLPMTRSTD